jgi:hypothetical protein
VRVGVILLWLSVFAFSQNLLAEYFVSEINASKTKVIISSKDSKNSSIKVGERFKATNSFGESCELMISSILNAKAIANTSSCRIKASLTPGLKLSKAGTKAITSSGPVSEPTKYNESSKGEAPFVQHGFVLYESVSMNSLTEDITGFSFGGRLEIGESMYFNAGYGQYSVSTVNLDVSVLGLGAIAKISSKTNVLMGLSYVFGSLESGSTVTTSSDTGAGLAVLHRANSITQMNFGVTVASGNASFSTGISLLVNPKVAFTIGLGNSDDSSSYYLGIRLLD